MFKTIYNDKELKEFDEVGKWVNSIINYFENVTDFKGYALLPENTDELMNIWEKCKDDPHQQRMIVNRLQMSFIESMRKLRSCYPSDKPCNFYLSN